MESIMGGLIRYVKEVNYGILAKYPSYSCRKAKRRPGMNRKTWRMSRNAHAKLMFRLALDAFGNRISPNMPTMTVEFTSMGE